MQKEVERKLAIRDLQFSTMFEFLSDTLDSKAHNLMVHNLIPKVNEKTI